MIRRVDGTLHKRCCLFPHFSHFVHYPNSSPVVNNAASLSCAVQRIWILLANICHGLLAGLALAHILFIGTTSPKDLLSGSLKSYLASTEIYTNTFYCLAILCLVSILDRWVSKLQTVGRIALYNSLSFFRRMDICRWTVLNANESISFRWIIIIMIYMATIILCLSSESIDERFYIITNVNTNDSTTTKEMVRIWWIWLPGTHCVTVTWNRF